MADFEFLIKLAEGKREVTITYCDYRLCHSNQQSVRDSDGSIPALGNEGNARAETRSAEDKRVKRMRSQGCGCSTLLQGLALVLGVVGQSRRAAARNRLQTPALTITYRAKQAIKHVARAQRLSGSLSSFSQTSSRLQVFYLGQLGQSKLRTYSFADNSLCIESAAFSHGELTSQRESVWPFWQGSSNGGKRCLEYSRRR
jgi:hypothetical protein